MVASPNDPSWRKNNHLFENIPPNVQGYVRQQLKTPSIYLATLLPDLKISVIDLVYSTTIPPICDDREQAGYLIPINHSFFATELPVEDIQHLTLVTVPPKGVVANLVENSKQQWLDGAESIRVPDEPPLPLWILDFWTYIYLTVQPSRESWRKGLEWLQREDFLPFPDQVRATIDSLATLSWSGNIAAVKSGQTAFIKSTLSGYLSRKWLADDHIDQMVYLLEKEVTDTFPSRNIKFIDTILGRKILQAFDDDQIGKSSYEPNGTTFLHRFGQGLSQSSELGGIFHVHGNHWVAVAIDIAREDLAYGDPAGGSPEPRLIAALRWFSSQHIPSLPIDRLDLKSMPCPGQDILEDSWSCGIFSLNALAHYFLQGRRPLLQNTGAIMVGDLARLDMLRRLLNSFNLMNSEDCALPLRLDIEDFFSLKPYRPQTPPPKVESLEFLNALQQLSVSPKKPKTKKRKTKENPITPTSGSVFAPIFQLSKPLGPTAEIEVDKLKRKRETDSQLEPTDDADVFMDSSPASPMILGNEATSKIHGRPRLTLLDDLTVELPTNRNQQRAYRCAGPGCNKIYKPRSRGRVLKHAKACLKLSSEQRKMAAAASAATAPGALAKKFQLDSDGTTCTPPPISETNTSPPPATPSSSLSRAENFFGLRGRKAIHTTLDLAIVKFICVGRIPPAIVDLPEWKYLFRIQTPSYQPASRTRLSEEHITSEQEFVREEQIAYLKTQKRLSISFDGGALRSGDSLYTVHATTEERKVILLEGQECTLVSHTGQWIAELVMRVVGVVGLERVISVSSDNTGNTRVAREIISALLPLALNLPDPAHHLNNTWKDIADLDYFKSTVKRIRGVIKYFKHSNYAKGLLKEIRIRDNIGPGLESIGKTRFATITWAAISLLRCLSPIRELCMSKKIEIPKYNDLFIKKGAAVQFELDLIQFISVGEGIARAIECLEATATNPADVYLYWLAVLASIKSALDDSVVPDDVRGQIRGILVARWREFFVHGPTNAHLSAFYLNPNYVRSTIFRNPNPFTFGITLPSKLPAQVPSGIQNPKTFKEVGAYLHALLVVEVNHGVDPFLVGWKNRPELFTKVYKAQFTAYAQGIQPFSVPLGLNQNPLNWWKALEGSPSGGILAAIAIKLYSSVPHSMADERTMSAITLLNTAQRNRQLVPTVIAMAQVRAYYMSTRPERIRKSAHPNPVLKFYDIERLLRSIDDDGRADYTNYDESDDEENVESDSRGPGAQPLPVKTSLRLPQEDSEGDIDLRSDELKEILADAPIVKKAQVVTVINEGDEQSEREGENGTFDLGEWV